MDSINDDILESENVLELKKIGDPLRNFKALFSILQSREILYDDYLKLVFRNCEITDSKDLLNLAMLFRKEMASVGVKVMPKDIEKAIHYTVHKDREWDGISCFVGEENGKMYVLKTDKKGHQIKEYISNFTLSPLYSLDIFNQDCQELSHVFELSTADNYIKQLVKLRAVDFTSAKELQDKISKQAGRSDAMLHNAYLYMQGIAHRYITLGAGRTGNTKVGTNVLGYERFTDSGEKYFCSTNGNVYDMHGNISEDIMYVGSDSDNIDKNLISSLTNLEYNKAKWSTHIVPMFAENVMKLHTKDNMLLILGWIAAVPHEANLRKKLFNAFPILHIAGKQGAGKSTILQALNQFLGYKSDTIPLYPTPAALTKSMTVGYTVISIFDEYGGSDATNGWSQARFNEIHGIMKHVYAKDISIKLGKGEGGQGSFNYKMRNCMASLGQRFITDDSIASRSIQIHIYDAFHKSPEGKVAKMAADNLREMSDKNFWVGFNLWCMQQEDTEVVKVAKDFYKHIDQTYPKMKSRQKDVASIVMTGLHFFKKMVNEYNVSDDTLGYTEEDILNAPSIMQEMNVVANGGEEEQNILHQFLKDIGDDAHAIGNIPNSGTMYGPGYGARYYMPSTQDAGVYGNDSKEACIYGRDLILVDVETMCNHINRKLGKGKYTYKDLNVYIQSEFQNAKQNGGDGLVLAPSGYRASHQGQRKKYTAFNRRILIDMIPEFGNPIFGQ